MVYYFLVDDVADVAAVSDVVNFHIKLRLRIILSDTQCLYDIQQYSIIISLMSEISCA